MVPMAAPNHLQQPIPHDLFDDGQGTRYIELHGWKITCKKLPILRSSEIDDASHKLGIPLPEMIFGKNEVCVEKLNAWSINFASLEALDLVDKTDQGGNLLKVAYSDSWQKERFVHDRLWRLIQGKRRKETSGG